MFYGFLFKIFVVPLQNQDSSALEGVRPPRVLTLQHWDGRDPQTGSVSRVCLCNIIGKSSSCPLAILTRRALSKRAGAKRKAAVPVWHRICCRPSGSEQASKNPASCLRSCSWNHSNEPLSHPAGGATLPNHSSSPLKCHG